MEAITVKVCYKGKTLIVGKGINSINQIVKELAKRFPEIEQIKQSLNVGFENGADDLLSAYKIAERQNKKFIKVRFSSDEQLDRSFISERTEDSCVISVLDLVEEREKILDFSKPQLAKPDEFPNQCGKLDVFQNLDEKVQIPIEITVKESESLMQAQSNSESSLVKAQKSEQVKQQPNPQAQETVEIKNKISEIKSTTEKVQNPIDYALLDDYFPAKEYNQNSHLGKNDQKPKLETLFGVDSQNQKKSEPLKENDSLEEKRKTFNSLFGLSQNKPRQQQSLSPQAQAILRIVRKQYDIKITTLQTKYNDLMIKYNILSAKCDHLEKNCDSIYNSRTDSKQALSKQNQIENQHKKKSKQEINKLENLFEEMWKEKGSSTGQNEIQLRNSKPVEYFAQISECSSPETVHVGEIIQSTFRIKNVGLNKWPQNVYAQQKNSDELIDVQSLEPNQAVLVTLHTQKAKKVGDKIQKIYQLVYFDEENNIRKFGRIFVSSVEVKQKKISDSIFNNPKSNKNKPNVPNQDKAIQFRTHVHDIMTKHKLTSKNLYDVISELKVFEITAQNFKDCDAKTLTELIRSICQ